MMDRADRWDRRKFVRDVACAATAGAAGLRPQRVLAEPPPETTKLRVLRTGGICWAPQLIAEQLLLTEGFSEIQYVEVFVGDAIAKALAADQADLSMQFVAPNIIRVEAGDPIVFLAGGHVGCLELRGGERVQTLHDLKGKTVAVSAIGSVEYVFISSMAAYVGLDPRRDIHWVPRPLDVSMPQLAEGTIDAVMTFPPFAQQMREKKFGRVIVNTATDRPWSQYFCCIVVGRREFVHRYPVATKRALRAILKAADVCALEPERAARSLLDKGYVKQYDVALQTMKDLPYGKWREYNPEDTIRFYALRLHEAGLIKSSPQKILAQGTDWRFLNELKKELKG